MTRDSRILVIVLLGISAHAGCSVDKKPRLVGTVTLDGSPIPDAQVQLLVAANNRPTPVCVGWTNAQGQYEIRNVTPRSYKVVIRKFQKPDGTSTTPADTFMLATTNGKGLKPLVPPEYLDPIKTPLTIEVKDKKQTENFDLKSTTTN